MSGVARSGRLLRMTRSPLRSLLLAGVLLACAAPIASADSIVYVDDGDVWSSHPDGSGKVRLTDGGSWHSPTQSDDGTIAAVQGTGPIVVMSRDGRPLHTITTQQAPSADGGTFAARPVALSFSPDGSKIAYSYVAYSCPVGSTCGSIQRSTFYTAADVTDATPRAVYGEQFSVGDPEWITNDRALLFGGYGSQVDIDPLGGGDYSFINWLKPNGDMGDGELSRDGKRLVTTFDYGSNKILAFWAVAGDPKTQDQPPIPDIACSTGKDAQLSDPSWSPDGTGVAFHSSEGIQVTRFSAYGSGSCTQASATILTATGDEPDWGPADPATARYVPLGATTTPTAAPAPAAAPVVQSAGKRIVTLTAGGAGTQRFRGTLSVACTLSAAGSCKAVAAVKVGTRTYTSRAATAKVAAGTATTLKLTFAKGAAKAIKKAIRHGKVKATVTLTTDSATATRVVMLKR